MAPDQHCGKNGASRFITKSHFRKKNHFFFLTSESLLCLALADIADLVSTAAPQGENSSGPRSKPRTIGGLCHHDTQDFMICLAISGCHTFQFYCLVTCFTLYFPCTVHHHFSNTYSHLKLKDKLQMYHLHLLTSIILDPMRDNDCD